MGVFLLATLLSMFGSGFCAGFNVSICSPLPATHVCTRILGTSQRPYYNFIKNIPGLAPFNGFSSDVNIALFVIDNIAPPEECENLWRRFVCLLSALPCDPATAQPYKICSDSCEAWELLKARSTCQETWNAISDLVETETFDFPFFSAAANLFTSFDCRSPSTYVFTDTAFAEENCTDLLDENITASVLSTDIECIPAPIGACTFVGVDAQSFYIPHPDRDPQQTFLSTTAADRDDDMFCSEALFIVACGFLFPPCQPERKTQVAICVESCYLIALVQERCAQQLERAIEADGNGTFGTFLAEFNCTNMDTFIVPGVPIEPTECISLGRLADEFLTQATEPPSSLTSGAVAGITVAIVTTALAVVAVVTIIAVAASTFRKSKRRWTIEQNATRPRNESVNDYSLKVLQDGDSELAPVVLSDSDRKQYEVIFASVLIPYSHLKLGETIGEGAFGKVFKAELSSSTVCNEVAIKTVKHLSSQEQLKEFFSESLIMKDFEHPNVLGLVGVCFDSPDGFPCIILPYMAQGNLRSYLKSRRVHVTDVHTLPEQLSVELLIHVCIDVACGMRYLAKRLIVHRDLAARNCMVDHDLAIRVGDFGLTRDIYTTNYYRANRSARLPVKWMPPETLHDGISNEHTDMWSFGVTCWEVFSLGRSPYPGVDNTEIVQHITSGGRLERPQLCPLKMFDILCKCWELKPEDRPTFSEMVDMLQEYWDDEHFYIVRSLSAV